MSVTANVTEKLTMINSTKTGSIQFKDRPFTVSFIGPTNFKAGLVYFGMVSRSLYKQFQLDCVWDGGMLL